MQLPPLPIVWSAEKNTLLKKARGISFEEVQAAIDRGDVLLTEPHPNQKKYSGQFLMVVRISEYPCMVPFVIDRKRNHVFLKTVIPNRNFKRVLDD